MPKAINISTAPHTCNLHKYLKLMGDLATKEPTPWQLGVLARLAGQEKIIQEALTRLARRPTYRLPTLQQAACRLNHRSAYWKKPELAVRGWECESPFIRDEYADFE